MDFSAFSNPTFDSVKWIDDMIADRPEDEQLDSFITSLTMKLHVVSQDYTDHLEAGMIDAAGMMPRCQTEISRSQGILKTLESEMASLAIQLQEFDQRNINGVEDLSRLDTLKLNMEKCKATLEEHARWSQLVREARSILESGSRFSETADRMETLATSLEILQSLPGHDDRMETYKALSVSLMASLQPMVLHEVMGSSVSALKEALYVYEKINRTNDFIEIYTTYRPQKLEDTCNDCFKSPTPNSAQVPEFYGRIYGFLSEEAENISSLFGDKPEDVSNLLCVLLEKIMTPLHAAMTERYKASDYATVETFSKRIAHLLMHASSDYLLKGLSSVYSCFLQNLNMLTNTEGKWIRVALHDSVSSLQLGSSQSASSVSTASATDINLADTGMEMDLEDEVLDEEDVMLIFESFGTSLATSVEVSCEAVQASLVRGLSFLGGLRSRRFLRFLVPLVSQHLKGFTSKVEELRAASDLSRGGKAEIDFTGKGQASLSVALSSDTKRYGIQDMGTSRGRVLLPSALQVFKAASIMNHQFLVIERVASEQLEEVYNQLFNGHSLKEIVGIIASHSSTSTSTGVNVSIGSALASLSLRQEAEMESELKAFLTASTRLTVSSVTQSVFSASLSSLIKFRNTAEEFLFDLTTFSIEAYLKDLYLDQAWGNSDDGAENEGEMSDDERNSFDEDNLLPQHAFTQVGEHLLSLLQELETFSSSNASSVSSFIHFQDDADALISKAWRPLCEVLELAEDEGYRSLSKRSTCNIAIAKAEQAMYGMSTSAEVSANTGDNNSLSSHGRSLDHEGHEEEDDILRFVNDWLGAISDFTVGVITVQIAQIRRLSALGRAQLRVDVMYLNNVINALGLARHPFLSHIVLLLEQDMEKVSTLVDFIPVTSAPLVAVHMFNSRVISAATASGNGEGELKKI